MRALPITLALCACSRDPLAVEPAGDSTGPRVDLGDGVGSGGPGDDDVDVTSGPGPVATTTASETTSGASGSGTDTGGVGCARGWPGTVVLACGSVDLDTQIVADEAFVYAVIDGDLVRVPHEGGDVEVLLPGATPRVLARHDVYLYWTQLGDGVLARLAVDAPKSVEVLIEGMPHPGGIAMDEGVAYVTTYFAPGAVMRVPTTGEPGSVLYGLLDHPGAIVRHEATLFFVDSNADGNDSTPILRGTTDAADLEIVDDANGIVAAMVLHGEQLYWALYRFGDSEIRTAALVRGATPTTLATTEAQPIGLAVTDERVVWSEIGNAGEHVALRSVSLDGGVVTDHLWDVVEVGHLVTTPSGVVFTTPEALARLP